MGSKQEELEDMVQQKTYNVVVILLPREKKKIAILSRIFCFIHILTLDSVFRISIGWGQGVWVVQSYSDSQAVTKPNHVFVWFFFHSSSVTVKD